jgi:hypothetical protein
LSTQTPEEGPIGRLAGADHLGAEGLGVGGDLALGQAGDGERVDAQHGADGLEHGGHAAGVGELLHQELAGGLEVDQQRDLAARAVEVVLAELDADPAGERDQVDHGVGGAADGRVDQDGVLEGFLGQDLGDAESSLTSWTIRRPVMWASACGGCRPRQGGVLGRHRPRPSTMEAMVLAVPMVLQTPRCGSCRARRP